jgi:hypothetical protein
MAITEARKEVNDLLKFTFKKNNLVLDRKHWESIANKLTKEEIEKEYNKLSDKGGNRAEWVIDHIADKSAVENFSYLLYFRIAAKIGLHKVSVEGNSEEIKQENWNDNKDTWLSYEWVRGDKLQVGFKTKDGINFKVLSQETGEFRLEFKNKEKKVELILNQRDDGTATFDYKDAKDTISIKAESLGTLVLQYPKAAAILYQLADHTGTLLPLSRTDLRVVSYVLQQSSGLEEKDKALLSDLLKKLGDTDANVRDKAIYELEQNAERFSWHIENYIHKKPSAEIASKLRDILNRISRFDDVLAIAKSESLNTNKEYFLLLLEHADESVRVQASKSLQNLTGKDFGTDQSKWEQYLRNNK